MGQDQGGRTGAGAADAGFTLIEVLVAATVLLLVLVPVSLALLTQTGQVNENGFQVEAAQLAAGQLESDRTTADNSSWSGSPPVPSLPTPATPVTVNVAGKTSVSYTVTASRGWCMQSGSTWTTTAGANTIPSGTAVAYKDVVTVKWTGGKVVSAQVFQIPSTSIGSPPTTATTCPS
jgi:prepilin-type N-terminal cleavage/methylation domain-containing protein